MESSAAPNDDCRAVRDVACGRETPPPPDVERPAFERSTVRDLAVVTARKKKGKRTANYVIVGGDDEIPGNSNYAMGCSLFQTFSDFGRVANFAGGESSSSFVELSSDDCTDDPAVESSCPGVGACANFEDSSRSPAENAVVVGEAERFASSSPGTDGNNASPDLTKGVSTSEENRLFGDFLDSRDGAPGISSAPETDVFECCVGEPPAAGDGQDGVVLGKRNRQVSTDSASSATMEVKSSRKTNKKPKKKDRGKQEEEEEINRILAELGIGDAPGKPLEHGHSKGEETIVAEVANPESKKRRKKKKKKTKNGSEVAVSDSEAAASDSQLVVRTVGTERNRASANVAANTASCEIGKPTDKRDDEVPDSDEGKKGRKRPGQKQLAAIHEHLRKAKEEEERLAQEERARQQRLAEAERLKLEKARLEEEKKERKRLEKKNKRERLRAEGKLLTKAQKAARARVQAALLAWKEHGVYVPELGEKRSASEAKRCEKLHGKTSSDGELPTVPSGRSLERMAVSSSEIADLDPEYGLEAVTANQGFGDTPTVGNNSTVGEYSAGAGQAKDEEATSQRNVVSTLDTHSRQKSAVDVVPRLRAKSAGDFFAGKAKGERGDAVRLRKFSESSRDKGATSLRSPVVCVLGHVDTGKTKILDKIRRTHVQDGEAGGITQQIGATMIPREAIREKCVMAKAFAGFDLQLPGLLVIDTPGHESFRNLRSRGSSLCDLAILVVDIMHGLEQQTIESIDLLKRRKTPFVVALNKIDRLYGWNSCESDDVQEVISRQSTTTAMEFDKKCKHIIAEFASQNLNAALFYENPDPRTFVSMIPVSAVTGDGMGNLLATVCVLCQNVMAKRLTFREELQATVLEVKTIPGLGTTIDVILVNGYLRESDTVVLAGNDGPVTTQIRSILMPQPLKELRVKNPYQEYKHVKGAQGVKVCGRDLEKAVAGLPLFVARHPEEVPDLRDKMNRLYRAAMSSIKVSERGVYVQASTLGSLEALLDLLKASKVPYAGVKVGPVVKKDVIKASVMLEHYVQYAVILAFDVKIEREAQELADHLGIKIFQADIIYHLFDSFVEYQEKLAAKKKNEMKKYFVLPCKLSILPQYVFSVRDPIAIGVRVTAGILKIGTPICVPSRGFLDLGVVSAIHSQNQSLEMAKEGDEVSVKIEPGGDESPKTYGKHFDHTDLLVSRISRQTIDVCKEYYRDDLRRSDWQLICELKKLFLIV